MTTRELTDAAREAQREMLDTLASNETEPLRDLVRRLPPHEVRTVSQGEGRIVAPGTEPAYAPEASVDVATIDVSDAAREIADRHLELCRQGEDLVIGVLAGLGYRYTGTGGWWITAYTTQEATLGFVNIAKGVAVATDVPLDPDVVTALTVPGQQPGPKVSGAAAWTSPDAGEGHRASAPDGWKQLAVDVRQPSPSREIDTVEATARVVAWGLMTCYNRLGEPGYTALDNNRELLPPEDWPRILSTAGMQRTAAEGLRRIVSIVAEAAGLSDEIREAFAGDNDELTLFAARGPAVPAKPPAGMNAAMRAAYRPNHPFRWEYDAAGAVEHVVSRHTIGAALPSQVTRLSALAGDGEEDRIVGLRWIDLISELLCRAVERRLTPVAEAMAAHMPPLSEGGMQTPEWRTLARTMMEPLVEPTVHHVLKGHLYVGVMPAEAPTYARQQPAESATYIAAETAQRALAAYQADGPIAVDIPLQPHRPRPDSPGQPVGATEIAAAAGVSLDTVEKWRKRHSGFPSPLPYEVAGRPVFRWGAVREWLEETGRLD